MPKSNTRWRVIILGILSIIAFSCLWIFKSFGPLDKTKNSAFLVRVPVALFAPGHIPCFNVEIEGKTFLTELDLGFNGDSSILGTILQGIVEKSFVTRSSICGLRGSKDQVDVYRIPKIKLGEITFSNLILEEESELLRQEAALVKEKKSPNYSIQGKLGWALFNRTSLFLDLGNSHIAICDSIETFNKQGCLEEFTKVPLLLDRNLIEFETRTPDRPLRCLLDTGCTSNLINRDNPLEESLENMIRNEKNFVKFSTFQIGGKNLGTITFRPFPLKLPVYIEAVLGMEFLLKHRVFIDFKNHEIYFSTSTSSPSSIKHK